jgi:protein-disulfide isomerase
MLDPGQTATLKTPVDERRDHIRGPRDAAVTLVEYGDFECPHCGRAHFILQDLEAMMGDRYRLAFRNFPLSQIHPYAERAAEAAEAAGAQGLFWEMHDTLFEHQDALEDEDLVAYADEIGCDLPRFQMDLLQGRFRERVREDFLGGVRSGVNGTPTFFINGRRHDAPWDLDALAEAIEMAAMTQGPGGEAGGADDRGGDARRRRPHL